MKIFRLPTYRLSFRRGAGTLPQSGDKWWQPSLAYGIDGKSTAYGGQRHGHACQGKGGEKGGNGRDDQDGFPAVSFFHERRVYLRLS